MVSLHEILENVKDDPMLKDLSFERALRYAVKLIRIVGVPKFYETAVDLIEVHDYKCLVPCDCVGITQIRNPRTGLCLRSAMETFHNVPGSASFETYKLQGNIIFFSFPEGVVEIAYKKMFVDDEGFPMIEDDAAFTNALELFIKKEYFTVLFNSGKLKGDILMNTKKDYAFAINEAQHSLTMPSVDEMQNIMNILNTPTMANNKAKHGFGRKFASEFSNKRLIDQRDLKFMFNNRNI